MLLNVSRRRNRDVSSTATRVYQCLEWLLILGIALRNTHLDDLDLLRQDNLREYSFKALFIAVGAWQALLLLAVFVVVIAYEARSQWMSLLLYVVIFPQVIAGIKCAEVAVSTHEQNTCLTRNVQISAVSFLYAFLPYWQYLGAWTPQTDLVLQILGPILSTGSLYSTFLPTMHMHVIQLGRALVGSSLNLTELSLLSHALTSFTFHYLTSVKQETKVSMPTAFLIAFLYGLMFSIFPTIPILKKNIRLARVRPQHRWKTLHKQQYEYAFFVYIIVAVVILTIVRWFLYKALEQDPFLFVFQYILESPIRVFLVAYWGGVAAAGVLVVIYFWGSKPVGGLSGFGENARRLLRHSTENDLHKASAKEDVFFEEEGTLAKRARALDRRRKFFHGLVVVLFLPTMNIDPDLSHLALSLAFTAFIFEEVLRVTVLPPFGVTIHKFLSGFTDHRDKTGHLVVSHLFLLIGVAGPVWLTLTGKADNQAETRNQSMAMLSGVLTLGAGDAAASIIGKKFGRHKWPGLKKSIEGTAAFVFAMLLGGYIATLFTPDQAMQWKTFVIGVLMTGLMEAVSTENDNLIIPIYMWCLIF